MFVKTPALQFPGRRVSHREPGEICHLLSVPGKFGHTGGGLSNLFLSWLQWKKILKFVVYTNPSLNKENAKKGITMGDDICG